MSASGIIEYASDKVIGIENSMSQKSKRSWVIGSFTRIWIWSRNIVRLSLFPIYYVLGENEGGPVVWVVGFLKPEALLRF